jgi:sugar O-acyltransferase (sialic acid O-acetyltransferase NeuD family)
MAHFYFTNDSEHDVVAFTVHEEHLSDQEYLGLQVVPFERVLDEYPPDSYSMFVAIGYRKVNQLRAAVYEEAKGKGYELVTYISSKATWWDANEIGDNCFIFEDNTIQPFVKIGNNVVMWSGNHIGHWVEVADHVFISSQVTISGYTKIGPYCFLGVNSTFRDVITVGASNVIGAGAIIMRDTEDREVYIPERTNPFPKKSDEINF